MNPTWRPTEDPQHKSSPYPRLTKGLPFFACVCLCVATACQYKYSYLFTNYCYSKYLSFGFIYVVKWSRNIFELLKVFLASCDHTSQRKHRKSRWSRRQTETGSPGCVWWAVGRGEGEKYPIMPIDRPA